MIPDVGRSVCESQRVNRSTSVREVQEVVETGAVESQAALSFLFP